MFRRVYVSTTFFWYPGTFLFAKNHASKNACLQTSKYLKHNTDFLFVGKWASHGYVGPPSDVNVGLQKPHYITIVISTVP